MKKLIFVVALVLLFCSVVYCQNQAEKPKPPVGYKNEIIAIRELYVFWAKAFETKDADRICSFVTDDFAMGYGDGIRDKKWLREFYIKRFSEGASWKIWPTVLIEISDSLDLAVSINNYEYTTVTKGEAKTTKSWALSALKKQKDGSWKFVSFN